LSRWALGIIFDSASRKETKRTSWMTMTWSIWTVEKQSVDALRSDITLLKLLIYKNVRQTNSSFARYG
jgi:hypothetical protein